ncbi:DUF1254 domain-containing protein [Rhizobium leguminosarum]
MKMFLLAAALAIATTSNVVAETPDQHGWIGTETVKTRFGDFEFRNGYPDDASAAKLREVLLISRAVEAYLAQMPAVSWYRTWKGVAAAGDKAPNQLVIWESLMDAQTLLLTGNTETVYGLAAIDLQRDGPVVIEVPPKMLGGFSDLWQEQIAGIGPTADDKGRGGKFLLVPPGYDGPIPEGYLVGHAKTFGVVLGMRGFLVEGKPEPAVALMKSTRIYPLSQASSPPQMTFLNGSGKEIDTLMAEDFQYFADLADLIEREPADIIDSAGRFQLAAIGIEKGKPFSPDTERKAALTEAARLASAMARTNSFASTYPERLVYDDRAWEWLFIGGSASWDPRGYVNTDLRAAFAYVAVGMSPAMVDKVVGQGSQYLSTMRDSEGRHLDGSKNYRLHLPANIPVVNFWSVVVYDSESRSELRNGKPFPSVSQYTDPQSNADGSIDVYFAPTAPAGKEKNWIRTVPGKGWFTLLRFYGPRKEFFDRSWKPDDIVEDR